ncbi:hypothetical protein MBANPS3_005843 [Mucor bainieri]
MAIFLIQANGQGSLTKCQVEREQAINLHVIGNFIPQCQPDGSYRPRQCYGSTGYCVCVNTITGAAISEAVGPTGDFDSMVNKAIACQDAAKVLFVNWNYAFLQNDRNNLSQSPNL